MTKRRLLTGLQPSGPLHIGNYFGALKPFLSMYEEYESMLMVADYHALTTQKNPEELRRNTLDIVKDYLAIGIDPKKAVIFRQSDVPEHMELAWIFQCLVTVPFLERAHAYKDKVAKGLEANAGLFAYPMLMAADILLYDTDIVPVGEDQRQHIEYAREAAVKFNNAYGDTFKEPREKILRGVATIPGVDGKKMSKSYGNTIPLFGSKEEIRRTVMSIVTDSKGESPEIVYAIHSSLKGREELSELYKTNRGNYKALKEALFADIEREVAPMREKRASIGDEDVKGVLAEGSKSARKLAQMKMKFVREKIGIAL
ncbi:MAG: Tryptophan-tRNA ligase [Parcubacteria group bacterium GW2011_GWA2_51_10]|nr:MAG: Tryptophan-tRNA ligase [Parcubacteria group bacterium GW2011_GWA2_51_10]